MLRLLCGECLGLLGAIDPGRSASQTTAELNCYKYFFFPIIHLVTKFFFSWFLQTEDSGFCPKEAESII